MGAFSLIVVINLLNRKILFLISSTMSGMGAKKQCIYPTAEQNLFKVESVKGNGLKKVLVIGYEGAGKSKLCNYLAGYESDVLFYQDAGLVDEDICSLRMFSIEVKRISPSLSSRHLV